MSEMIETPRPEYVAIAAAERYMRGGLACRISGPGEEAVVRALEAVDDTELTQTIAAGDGVTLLLSARRAAALGIRRAGPKAVRLDLPGGVTVDHLRALADPTRVVESGLGVLPSVMVRSVDVAAVELCKIAGLLPAALVGGDVEPAVDLDAAAVMAFREATATSLEPVSGASVPLLDAATTRFIAFRSRLGGPQHHAVLVGQPERIAAPLCRLHSECFTGDIFGSLRCDCGEQLRGAIRRMDEAGGGVLLYLAQEGRGIGLANKLRAYTLQDQGIDTVDANTHLGFEPDEREFLAAATMLRRLGFASVRLLTNNPDKVTQLARHGIEVTERVPHSFAANSHNRFYLETKARRSGHLLSLADLVQRGAA